LLEAHPVVPARLSLQPSLATGDLAVVDFGMGTVGAGANTHRHLQSRLTPNGTTEALAADIAERSKTEIGLDPVSLLPAVLTYSVHPDNGAPATIAIEVHYSESLLSKTAFSVN
jgi:hypothetical protein